MSILKPWVQELIWVRRNERGILINISEKPPQTGEMIPTMSLPSKKIIKK